MCTDEKDIEELEEMYEPLCWQGYDKDPGGFEKLMWYEIIKRIQLRGHFRVIRARKSKRNCLHAQSFEPREERGDIAAGLHHRTKEKK